MTFGEVDHGWMAGLKLLLLRGRSAWLRPPLERRLELIETLSLGGRRQLVLVRCGGEEILLGLGSDSVQSMMRVAGRPAAPDEGSL